MAKHGKQLSDDTNNTIVQLIEGGYRASEVANILNISKSTIFKLLRETFTGVLLNSRVISFNVALREVLAIRFSTLSPLLEANFERHFIHLAIHGGQLGSL
jgi:hypothetical protein